MWSRRSNAGSVARALVASLGLCACGTAFAGDDASKAARDPQHIGHHCSYNTKAMIRMVLEKGASFAYNGNLASAKDLGMDVAAPYVLDDGVTRVLANVVLDKVVAGMSADKGEIQATGKLLEHQGVRYLVLVEATPASS